MMSLKAYLRQGRSYTRLLPLRNTGTVETALVAIQSYTHLPWFATFAISTVCVRFSLLPLVRAQILESKKLAEAMPKMEFLVRVFREKLKSKAHPLQATHEFSLLMRGTAAVFHFHEVSLLRLFAFPALNIGIFATFVFALRDMIVGSRRADLSTGGILWFEDLISKDPTYVLPLAAVGASYLALEIALSRTNQSSTLRFTKDLFQSVLILSIPFVVHMPSGLFFYWIPSSLCGIAQHILLRHPRVMALLRIPSPQQPPGSIKNE